MFIDAIFPLATFGESFHLLCVPKRVPHSQTHTHAYRLSASDAYYEFGVLCAYNIIIINAEYSITRASRQIKTRKKRALAHTHTQTHAYKTEKKHYTQFQLRFANNKTKRSPTKNDKKLCPIRKKEKQINTYNEIRVALQFSCASPKCMSHVHCTDKCRQ